MGQLAFIDLHAQRRRIGQRIPDAINRVLERGDFISGVEVEAVERDLGVFSGAPHVISCANGTDAITLSLMAEGVGAGDIVFVPSFTFIATAEAPSLVGAHPYFVDVNERSFNIDVDSLQDGIEDALSSGLRPRAIIAVDLFGLPADYTRLKEIAAKYGLLLVADSAQGFGGEHQGVRSGTLADYTTTSFFPAKPLGCYGDGGAIFTNDDQRADRLRSLRVHGKGSDKYDNVRVGLNSRLDTLQAALLIEKLAIFAEELDARDAVAARYSEGLADAVITPTVENNCRSSWAQYTIRLPQERRDAVASALRERGIPTQVYYATPMHRQTAYTRCRSLPGGLPVSERLAREVLSLPMHPYLDRADQDRVIASVRDVVGSTA